MLVFFFLPLIASTSVGYFGKLDDPDVLCGDDLDFSWNERGEILCPRDSSLIYNSPNGFSVKSLEFACCDRLDTETVKILEAGIYSYSDYEKDWGIGVTTYNIPVKHMYSMKVTLETGCGASENGHFTFDVPEKPEFPILPPSKYFLCWATVNEGLDIQCTEKPGHRFFQYTTDCYWMNPDHRLPEEVERFETWCGDPAEEVEHLKTDELVCPGFNPEIGNKEVDYFIRFNIAELDPTTCFEIAHNDSSVCGGQGTCVSEDTCECTEMFQGKQCDELVCTACVYGYCTAWTLGDGLWEQSTAFMDVCHAHYCKCDDGFRWYNGDCIAPEYDDGADNGDDGCIGLSCSSASCCCVYSVMSLVLIILYWVTFLNKA